MVGHRIAAYTVTGTLGRGGYGEVLAGVHDVLGRDVAIKVLHAKWSDDGEAVSRFVAEARAVNAVRHPNIVDVFDFGTLEDGRHYHVMERLKGESLHARLRARGPLSLVEAVPILRAIAAALDAAHAAGIIHRDVKPENVFLHADADREIAKLIDFGLAKLIVPTAEGPTQSGVILGTPAYMAPEQCRGAAIDPRTDVYAFGVVAYEMLTGSVPHRGADPVATLLAHVHDDTEPPSQRNRSLPSAVDSVVLPLLEKHPAKRPTQLAAIVDALAAIADGTPRIEAPPRRRWWFAGAAIVLGSGLVAAIAVTGGDQTRAVEVAVPAPRDAMAISIDAPVTPVILVTEPPPIDAAPRRPRRGNTSRPNPEEPEVPDAR